MTEVRRAAAADAAAIIAVRVASWRAAYGPLLPEDVWQDYDEVAAGQRLGASIGSGRTRALVAAEQDTVFGYALYGAARDGDLPPGTGEIYALYVHPEHWSSGVGRAVLESAVTELAAPSIVLWVLEANTRARRFYERAGFLPDGAEKPADMPGGVRLPELRYGLSTERVPRAAAPLRHP